MCICDLHDKIEEKGLKTVAQMIKDDMPSLEITKQVILENYPLGALIRIENVSPNMNEVLFRATRYTDEGFITGVREANTSEELIEKMNKVVTDDDANDLSFNLLDNKKLPIYGEFDTGIMPMNNGVLYLEEEINMLKLPDELRKLIEEDLAVINSL